MIAAEKARQVFDKARTGTRAGAEKLEPELELDPQFVISAPAPGANLISAPRLSAQPPLWWKCLFYRKNVLTFKNKKNVALPRGCINEYTCDVNQDEVTAKAL
jgi:hypothetical protein